MRAIIIISILALMAGSVPAQAQEDGPTPDPATARQGSGASFDNSGEYSPFSVSAIDEGALQAIAGREDTAQLAQAEQFAGVAQNSVGDNSVTGDARIADNAFQNMSGLSILNVNTGNNVAINASMNVNVSISPAP